jgi:hypothetical protein
MKSFKLSNVVITIAFLLFPVSYAKAEILEIPSYGTPTITSSPLEDGKLYQIEVRGTIIYDSYHKPLADAEWAQWNPPNPSEPWVENLNNPNSVDSIDLYVNGLSLDWMGTKPIFSWENYREQVKRDIQIAKKVK